MASLDEVVNAEGARLCAAGPLVDLGPEWTLPCDALTTRSTRAGGASLEALAVDFVAGGQIWSVLAVRGAGETLVGTLASGWAPGVGGQWAEGTSAVEAVDLLPGGELELHATFTGAAGDSDMGSCDFRGREGAVHVLCSVDGGALRCVALETTHLRTYEHTRCDDAAAADGDPAPVELEANVREGWALDVVLGAGTATFTPAPADTVAPPLAGEIASATLLARDDLAWPARFTTVELLAN